MDKVVLEVTTMIEFAGASTVTSLPLSKLYSFIDSRLVDLIGGDWSSFLLRRKKLQIKYLCPSLPLN